MSSSTRQTNTTTIDNPINAPAVSTDTGAFVSLSEKCNTVNGSSQLYRVTGN